MLLSFAQMCIIILLIPLVQRNEIYVCFRLDKSLDYFISVYFPSNGFLLKLLKLDFFLYSQLSFYMVVQGLEHHLKIDNSLTPSSIESFSLIRYVIDVFYGKPEVGCEGWKSLGLE